jgi:hypothetical protein
LDNYHLRWKNMSLWWRQSQNLCFIYFSHCHLTIVIFGGRMCLPHEGKSSSLDLSLFLCVSLNQVWSPLSVNTTHLKIPNPISCKAFQCWILNNIFANAFKSQI